MALIDLIAQSGAKNFETFRKGWLPTAQEKAASRMAELQVQAKQQAVDYEPDRQKLAREKGELDIQYKTSLKKKLDLDMGQRETEQEQIELAANQKTMGLHFQAAKSGSVDKTKEYLNKNRKQILLAGSPEEDEAFDSIMGLKGDKFNKAFKLLSEGNNYIQGLNEKRFGQSTSFQNYKTGELDNVMLNDFNYQRKTDDLLSRGFKITKKPGMELQGTPDQLGLKDKTLNRELINEESAIRSANFIGKRTIDTLMNSPESLATTGAFSRIASSLKSQLDSTAKLMGIKWKQGTDFDPDSYRSIFQNAGIDNVIIKGNLTQLARMLATASGESKVLSNADMKRWLNVVAVGNGDPKIVSAAIRNALEIQNFRFKEKYRISTKREYKEDLGFPARGDSDEVKALRAREAELTQMLKNWGGANGTP
jgi:hypothetical protein